MSARVGTAIRAVRDFLRGFLGLAGTPGTATPAGASPAEARRALAERAARRPSCC